MIGPPGIRILCPTCYGNGSREIPRRAMLSTRPEINTIFSVERCKHCGGTGWLGGPPPTEDANPE